MTDNFTVFARHKFGLDPRIAAAARIIDGTDGVPPDPATLRDVAAIVIAGRNPLPNTFMDQCPRLRHIHCIGAGFDNIDMGYARTRDLYVTHGSGANASSVADHALALLLGLLRRLPELDRSVRAGEWRTNAVGGELSERRVGLIGFGQIGQAIARRLAAFDAKVTYMATRKRDEAPYDFAPDIATLTERCDTLIVACPDTPATRHIVDRAALARLGKEGLVINIGRGPVIATDDLIAALRDGTIAGAGLDVFEGEPGVPEALRALPNTILTPHVAGSTLASIRNMQDVAVANVIAISAGRTPLNPVPGGRR
ncbi:MAG: NAD(P)-binding domain-containing protein [Alphaproteobacteria bacterium]|nr:NAD(P)-binding domain-containing protein [Alphaproteobacteria bacterium]